MHQLPQLSNLHLVRGPRFQRHPRHVVVFSVPSRPLGGEVGEGIESQGPAEPLLVDPVGSLDLAVALRRPRADELVRHAALEAEPLEEIGAVPADGGKAAPFGPGPAGELEAAVGLYLLRLVSEKGNRLLEPPDGLVRGMLVGVMEEPLPLRLVAEAFYLAGRLLGRLPRVPRVGPAAPVRQGGIGAAVPLPPPPEAGPLGLVAGEGLPYAPARFRGPPHRTEPRLRIVGQEIPRPFAYNAHGISFHAFLVENIIRRDAFSFAPARTPYGVWDGGRLSASDFVSHHLK